jgi:hypothetical protein
MSGGADGDVYGGAQYGNKFTSRCSSGRDRCKCGTPANAGHGSPGKGVHSSPPGGARQRSSSSVAPPISRHHVVTVNNPESSMLEKRTMRELRYTGAFDDLRLLGRGDQQSVQGRLPKILVPITSGRVPLFRRNESNDAVAHGPDRPIGFQRHRASQPTSLGVWERP